MFLLDLFFRILDIVYSKSVFSLNTCGRFLNSKQKQNPEAQTTLDAPYQKTIGQDSSSLSLNKHKTHIFFKVFI